ncbi:SprT-like domain-containing protein [Akkermansiaceae bacterium]|nr:SprT-like domain-containing protein [Akkermansiaceae bacterium]MDB4536990.1 SprT-like domain-containing protein [Akkermansiaceae bacterium]
MFRAARQVEFDFLQEKQRAREEPGVSECCSKLMGMDTNLTELGTRLLLELGLDDLAKRVSVGWNPRMRSSAGRATWPTALVELNPRLPDISQDEVRRTLLHELAHLVAYERSGNRRIQAHGAEWQRACADLGIPGEKATHRLALPSRSIKRRWRYQCPSCESSFDRVRRYKGRVACYECCRNVNGGEYDESFRLVELSLR